MSSTILSLQSPPTNISLLQHSPTSLLCQADGTPPPSYRWLYNTTLLSSQPSLTPTQSGLYTCQASNTHGTVSAGREVRVEEAPRCRLERAEGEEGQERLVCRLTAGDPQLSHFSWSGDLDTAGSNYSVVTLQPSLAIFQTSVTCRVTNRVGWGECTITIAPTITTILPFILSLVISAMIIIFCLYKLRSTYWKIV